MSIINRTLAVTAFVALFVPAAFAAEDGRYELTYAKNFAFKGGRVTISNSFGNVNVQGGGGTDVQVRATIRSSDAEFGKQIRVIAGSDASGVNVRTEFPAERGTSHLSYSVDYQVTVPAGAPVKVVAKFGNTTITGTSAGSTVEASQGAIALRDTRGRQDLTNSFGPVDVVSNTGDVVARNTNGPVTVRENDGALDLSNRFGPVSIVGTRGAVKVTGANGPIDLRDSSGSVTLVNSFGPVSVKGVRGNVTVTTANGPARIKRIDGNVKVASSFGGISLDAITGDIDAQNQMGAIALGGLSGGACRNVTLRTSQSTVRVALPASSNYSVSAKTSFGTVRNDLPLKISTMTDQVLTGSLGNGGCRLNIENQNGNITLTSESKRSAVRVDE